MLSSLVGVKRAAEIVQAMDSFTFVGSDRAYETKCGDAVSGALKGPGKRPGDYTPESIEAYLKSPLFDATLPVEKPRRHKGFDCKLVHSEVTKVSYMSILCFQHQKRRRRRRHPAARTRLRTAVRTLRRRTPCSPEHCKWWRMETLASWGMSKTRRSPSSRPQPSNRGCCASMGCRSPRKWLRGCLTILFRGPPAAMPFPRWRFPSTRQPPHPPRRPGQRRAHQPLPSRHRPLLCRPARRPVRLLPLPSPLRARRQELLAQPQPPPRRLPLPSSRRLHHHQPPPLPRLPFRFLRWARKFEFWTQSAILECPRD